MAHVTYLISMSRLDGLLDDFKNDIEKYYIPIFNDIARSNVKQDASKGVNSSLDEIADMEIFDSRS